MTRCKRAFYPPPMPMKACVCPSIAALLLSTAVFTNPMSAQSVAPNTSPPPATANGGPIVLSPFQVDEGSEKGYLATQTLSGTRLKTDLRDIGAALTIFTE